MTSTARTMLLWRCAGKGLFRRSWSQVVGGRRNFRAGSSVEVSISPSKTQLYANNSSHDRGGGSHHSLGDVRAEDDDDHSHERLDLSEEEQSKLPSHGFTNEHFVRLSPIQKAVIFVGSGLSAFFDPTKPENIATFGEISATPVLRSLHEKMMKDPEAARILTQKPRINSKTVNLEWLATLPEDTLGAAYIRFLRKNNVTPDSRLPVRFIEDPELAYVIQRYREVHDLVHTVSGQPTNMLGEVVVKWIEGIQTGLPMCLTGGLFGATRLRPKQRARYSSTHLNWALEVGFNSKPFLNIFYEERWEQPIDELRNYISPLLLKPPA